MTWSGPSRAPRSLLGEGPKGDQHADLRSQRGGIRKAKRMPAVLGEGDEESWLDPATSVDTARAMCMTCQSEWLAIAPVA
jgi:hypothetical protein